MDMRKAVSILGINRTRDGDLREMVKALGLMSFLNTAEENERRKAAQYVLKRWPEYQKACNAERDLRVRYTR